ncbi:hypothetical protein DSCA_33950 [Desulfosarcina alkanivorans]|uniref:Phosphatidylcholine 1-acylhydrolase n=1 Tax=Desulfosarcina alkanivorans TaxID=571177 RepID=A0A5K7YM58_9BACT|nr:phospholipase A [Desulfosarcina alkanivorans]BBO69465.1 hypothetical protein DSCA_33950 [Desulfosarcina alkanivorans]
MTKKMAMWRPLIIVFLLLPGAGMAQDCSTLDACMADMLETAPDSVTVGELKQYCRDCVNAHRAEGPAAEQEAEKPPSPVEVRLKEEGRTSQDWFVLTPHRANYLLPVAYNSSPNEEALEGTSLEDAELDNVEVKFQISVKYQLFDNIFKDNGDLYVAYTNQSYWQAYNSDNSSPFRDTNHEPEAWVQFDTDWKFWGFKTRLIAIGAAHQSNGRAEPLSRSWNRLYASILIERNHFVLGIKPWWRVPEDDDDDDNPDIDKYMGYGELRVAYKWNDHTFSMMMRNNLRSSGNKGAVELGWSFPLYRKLKGYVQYFNGYGQSILDYDDSANTIGVGFALSDIL